MLFHANIACHPNINQLVTTKEPFKKAISDDTISDPKKIPIRVSKDIQMT